MPPPGLLIGAAGLGLLGAACWLGSPGLLVAGIILVIATYRARW